MAKIVTREEARARAEALWREGERRAAALRAAAANVAGLATFATPRDAQAPAGPKVKRTAAGLTPRALALKAEYEEARRVFPIAGAAAQFYAITRKEKVRHG